MKPLATAPARDRGSVIAYLAFFLSGASSLIFQTLWTRMLHHVFGATSVAISTVLTVFMAGLGLGAWLAGRYANRIKHPLITYAIAEIGVGLWGLLIPFLVTSDGWLATVNAFLRAELGGESGLFMIARFLCVAPILIVPTTLMGSTLPLLTRHFVSVGHGAREAGAKVGFLYAVNTFGAAAGPLLSAFVLMPTIHLFATNLVACSMNFTLAALILIFRRSLLGASWKPGERLSFWPAKEEADATPAEPPSDPDEAPRESAPEAKASKRAARDPESRRKSAAKTATRKPARSSASTSDGELAIPELARKAAFVAFAASGAAALCYEVVWSRALAMTIGSSIYSFALILETFLIGIAGGSAAMSAFLGRRTAPYVGIAVTAVVLVALANVPWLLDMHDPSDDTVHFQGSGVQYALMTLLFAVPVVLLAAFGGWKSQPRSTPSFGELADVWRPLVIVAMVAMPVLAAVMSDVRFPGYLPQIILSVVAAVAVFLLLAAFLSRHPALLLAIVQLFIAGATLVSYIWQDEIPRAFAQLVVSIPQQELPSHTGTVKVFMWLTVALCTLPATLGMGAMFPLTVRVWTAGGDKIARDVAMVYTGNTVGSIVGAWLPGFVLFVLIGAERTLTLGIALNMVLALMMLIAGAAEPTEDQSFWSWRRLCAVAVPALAAACLIFSVLNVDTTDWRWWLRVAGIVGFFGLAALEAGWLRKLASDQRPAAGVALVLAFAPLVAAIAFAAFMVDPRPTDSWALQAVHASLRAFIVLAGATASWANWRELSMPAAPKLAEVQR